MPVIDPCGFIEPQSIDLHLYGNTITVRLVPSLFHVKYVYLYKWGVSLRRL